MNPTSSEAELKHILRLALRNGALACENPVIRLQGQGCNCPPVQVSGLYRNRPSGQLSLPGHLSYCPMTESRP